VSRALLRSTRASVVPGDKTRELIVATRASDGTWLPVGQLYVPRCSGVDNSSGLDLETYQEVVLLPGGRTVRVVRP